MTTKTLQTGTKNLRNDLPEKKPLRFHIDGFGTGKDFDSAVTAYVSLDGNGEDIQWIHTDIGISNSAAELRAVIHLLRDLEPGSYVQIFTDSKLVVRLLEDPLPSPSRFFDFLYEIGELKRMGRFRVDVEWIPRAKNLAGRLIRKALSQQQESDE